MLGVFGKLSADEAQARCQRSVRKLIWWGVPFTEHLPLIETEAETTIRSPLEVGERVRCLAAVMRAAQTGDLTQGHDAVAQWNVRKALTPEEAQYLNGDDSLRIKMSRRAEAMTPLLWACGRIRSLDLPRFACDAPKLFGHCEDMQVEPELRPANEILDQADLIYRIHWATRQAGLEGKRPPARLDPEIVMERHHALNWLISYEDQPWDEVTCDT